MDEREAPPTDLCLLLRPWLSFASSLYVGVGLLRIASDAWGAFVYILVGVMGLQASFKSLRMNVIPTLLLVSILTGLSDVMTFAIKINSGSIPVEVRVAPASTVSVLAAPCAAVMLISISIAMIRDYTVALEARADEERRLLIRQAPSLGFSAFSGRGRRIDE